MLFALALSGCAGVDYRTLDGFMSAGDCRQAVGHLEKSEKGYGKNGRLLYLLDSAQINMLCRNYEKSNDYFHSAEQLAEELYTKSITKEAASFLLNDYTKPYAGEDFEKALINLLSAVNYLMLGQNDEALVECRRLDANLNMFNTKYEKKNVYKEDAFGRYLSGMIYESVGSLDDAYIDYYKAYKVFKDYRADYGTPVSSALIEDLRRAARKTGRLDELKELGIEETGSGGNSAKGLSSVVLIHLNGRAPFKDEDKVILPSEHGPITLAFPRFVVTPPSCRQPELSIGKSDGGENFAKAAELVEDINAIAAKNLDDRKGRVIAKALARAVAKQAAINKSTKDEKAKVLFNIANIFIERADTRSWRTLPGEIYLARVFLPAGRYEAYVSLCGQKKSIGSFELKAGETKFLMNADTF